MLSSLSSRRRGFTLVEMLLVVSIIMVLISMLLPALSKTRGMARRTVCQANLHALGDATIAYAATWKGKIFPYDNKNGGLYYETFWMTLLSPHHAKTDQFRLCPETVMDQAGQSQAYAPGWGTVKVGWGMPWLSGGWGFLGKHYGSYAWNSWMHSGRTDYAWGQQTNQADDLRHWKNFRKIHTPRDTPMLTDGTWVDTWFHNNPTGIFSNPPANLFAENSGAGRVCVTRHDRGVIHVFADGSTRWTKLEDLWQLRWNTESKPMAPPFALPAN